MINRGVVGCQIELRMGESEPVDHAIVGEERDDLHRGATPRADHGVNFIDLPAMAGDWPQKTGQGHRQDPILLKQREELRLGMLNRGRNAST